MSQTLRTARARFKLALVVSRTARVAGLVGTVWVEPERNVYTGVFTIHLHDIVMAGNAFGGS